MPPEAGPGAGPRHDLGPALDGELISSKQPRTPNAQTDPRERGRYHPASRTVLALAGIVMLAATLRSAVTSLPPLLGRIGEDLDLTPVVTGLLGALPPLMFSVAGVMAVRLMRRFSAERLAVTVLLIAGLGQLARPWAPGVTGFLAVSTLTLLAMGTGNIILPPLVKAWFPHRIGLVTGAYVTVLSLGTAIPALAAVPLANALPDDLGWRGATAIWGFAGLLALPVWLVVAARPRAIPARDGVPGTRAVVVPVHRSRLAWALALLFITNSMNLYAMFTWLPVRLREAGLSETAGGFQLAVFAGIGLVPSLLFPPILARYGHTFALISLCAGLFAVGYAGLLLAPDTLTTLWTVLAGMGGGTFPVVLTLFGLRSATPATAGALAGFAQAIGYLGAATGPVLFGVLHDVSNGWGLPFGFLFASLVVMVFAGWICSGSRTVDDELRARPGQASPADTLAG